MYQPPDNTVTTRQGGGHLNLVPQQGNLELRRNFWSVRVGDKWNTLPDSVKMANTVNDFKKSIDNLKAGPRRPG